MSDRQAIYDKVKSEYETQFKITWLDAAPFNNTQALAVTRATSDELGLTKVSQLAALAPQLRVGGPPEFFEREDGLPGVKVTYGDMSFAEEVQVDPGLRYEALLNDEIDWWSPLAPTGRSAATIWWCWKTTRACGRPTR